MKERPILFSAPMVRAILTDAKTQTRRIVGPQQPKPSTSDPYELELTERDGTVTCYTREQFVAAKCRYGQVGDRLWLRETHAQFSVGEGMDRPVPQCVAYRASCDDDSFTYVNGRGAIMQLRVVKWTPAIHMPRWASRITLEITDIRVQPLHEISDADARAEGIDLGIQQQCTVNGEPGHVAFFNARTAFAYLWDSVNGKRAPWKSNPWVWTVTFKRIEQ